MTDVVLPSIRLRASQSVASLENDFPPAAFVYKHLHNSIREDLAQLSAQVQAIESIVHTGKDVTERLVGLRKRYQMLVQVNRYHSCVEDEIVYPAVEYKVQNVTHSYSVEHGEEDLLLDSLQQLIESAINADVSERDGFVHELCCKVEEVHVTLQKHFRKEEDQLFPLLLQHFTFSEQADLVVQFICCIPVMSARSVLNWLRNSTVSYEEQVALRQHVSKVTVDPHLRRLLTHWLQPTSQASAAPVASTNQSHSNLLHSRARAAANPSQPLCPTGPVPEPLDTLVLLHRGLLQTLEALTDELQQLALCGRVSAKQIQSVVQRWQFLCTVSAFHRVSEDEFVFPMARALGLESSAAHCAQEHWGEAQALTKLGRSLNELESCARRNAANVAQLLKELVVLANDVSAAMKAHLAKEEQDVLPALRKHLSRPEKHSVVWKSLQALPLRLLERIMPWVALHIGTQGLSELMRHPAEGEDPVGDAVLVQLLSKWSQRAFSVPTTDESFPTPSVSPSSPSFPVIITHNTTFPAECVHTSPHTPSNKSVAAQCNNIACEETYVHSELHTPTVHASGTATPASPKRTSDVACVAGGKALHVSSPPHSPIRLTDDPHLAFHITTCAPALVRLAPPHMRGTRSTAASTGLQANGKREGSEENEAAAADLGTRVDVTHCPQKRRRLDTGCALGEIHAHSAEQGDGNTEQQVGTHNPIDHIFQFHKALRRELHQVEYQARTLQAMSQDPRESASSFDLELQRLSGRFLFVQGIYQAHSVSEDEVVFPALEAKHTLRNVSKFYVLDHEHETQLFAVLQSIIHSLQQLVKTRPSSEASLRERDAFKSELSGLVGKLRLKCASVRASLETHVKAEEAEIWPLFSEHFTVEEQSTLVGTIIGRTGAVVLQALIPWVMNSFSQDETLAMMDSLRSAAKNTRFDRWLESMVPSGSNILPADESDVNALTAVDNTAECHSMHAPHVPTKALGSMHLNKTTACALADTSCQQNVEVSGCSAQPSAAQSQVLVSASISGCQHAHGGDTSAAALLPAVPHVLHKPSEKDLTEYRPGWVDVFRMNASQLESAAANSTPNDKHRDKYLAHHLMVSRFLVAQQQRMHSERSELGSAQSTCTSGMTAATFATRGFSMGGQPLAGAVSVEPSHATSTVPTASTSSGSCMHYEKKCNVVAPCCGVEVSCRLCHDEQMTCSQEMDRYKVTEMVCKHCGKKQRCAQMCVECHTVMARYYCSVCNLFDDTEGRDIYHCPFCNMCRRGKGLGIDAFHCMRCNACMSLDLFNNHPCREHAMESNCPICHEDLFESSIPVKELPCGHLMHSICFAQHTQHRYTCPICFKTAGDLTLYFQMLDRLLCDETMPEQLANLTQNIQCNDCSTKATVKYHFVYHKCPSCNSYNTRVL